jgi:hypothetical protein
MYSILWGMNATNGEMGSLDLFNLCARLVTPLYLIGQ